MTTSQATAAYTWPDLNTDYLEALIFQQRGFNALNFAGVIQDCQFSPSDAAKWIRTAFHDMATADVKAGTGGIDASIGFELDRGENLGKGLTDTINDFAPNIEVGVSMADMIALGASYAFMICSGTNDRKPGIMPFRSGRVDATRAGPPGVPEPQQNITTHKQMFARQGFNTTEMIGLVACGHSIGGIHQHEFPQISKPPADVSRSLCKVMQATQGLTEVFQRIPRIPSSHSIPLCSTLITMCKCRDSTSTSRLTQG
jgi:hypothetical protein